jgi:integrase
MLTNRTARDARPREKSYKVFDAKGLYLQIEPNGSKYWRLKYRFAGKHKTLALGLHPEVSLTRARAKRLAARRLLDEGVDPREHKRQTRMAAINVHANTFRVVANEWFAKFSPRWTESHGHVIRLRLENDIFPRLGSRPIASIEAPEILDAIRRVETRGALASAHRCLSCCGRTFRYAVATGRAKRNPATDLLGALPPPKTAHFASITDPQEVGALLRAIDGYRGALVTRCALKLAPLVFVRPGELRQAEWAHIDLCAAEWRIPAAQTKMRRELIVPLSQQVMAILRELQSRTGHRRYLFPSVRRPTKAMSSGTINAALRRLGYSCEQMTGHGFRAMARTILDEVLSVRVEWIETSIGA